MINEHGTILESKIPEITSGIQIIFLELYSPKYLSKILCL